MASLQDASGRARLIRQFARNPRRNDSTVSSMNSHASANSAFKSDFDPENEAMMSTRPFDKSPKLNPLTNKEYLRPQAAYTLDKEALKRILPESEDGSSQGEEEEEEEEEDDDSIEVGRGVKKTHRIVEDSRNDESILSDANVDDSRLAHKSALSSARDTRMRHNTRDLRRDVQLRLASMMSHKENIDPEDRATTERGSRPQVEKRVRKTLGEMHTKAAETYDGSLIADERPATVTFTTKNTRFGSGAFGHASGLGVKQSDNSRIAGGPSDNFTTDDNQSYMLPDLPNLSELVSGIYQDGTPVFPRTASNKPRFGSVKKSRLSKTVGHLKLDAVPIPDDEKAIFISLKLLQDKVAELELAKAKAEKDLEGMQEANAELLREKQEAKRYRRSDSALGTSEDDEDNGRGGRMRKVENANASLQTKLETANRKIAVSEITIKNLSKERDSATAQLGIAFLSIEELKSENAALQQENEDLKTQLAQISAFAVDMKSRQPAQGQKGIASRNVTTRATTQENNQDIRRSAKESNTTSVKERQSKATAQVNDELSRITEDQQNDDLFSIDNTRGQERRISHSKVDRKTRSSTTKASSAPRAHAPFADAEYSEVITKRTQQDVDDGDRTYLSFMKPDNLARLRKRLEEERIARKAGLKQHAIDEVIDVTVRSSRARPTPVPETTLPRKSSMKESNKASNVKTTSSRAHEATLTRRSLGYTSRFQADDTDLNEDELSTKQATRPGNPIDRRRSDPTVTGVSAVSNTSRRRYRPAFADDNMTSAFILPDITIAQPQKQADVHHATEAEGHSASPHDGTNCIVCQRILLEAQAHQSGTEARTGKETISIPRPIPVSDRMPEATESNPDPTVRPSQPPSLALAIALKTLEDELAHLKAELAVQQARYNGTDPSLSRRERKHVQTKIQKLLKACERKADLIYALYDVLEGQKDSGREMTAEEVEVTLMNLKDVIDDDNNNKSHADDDMLTDTDQGSGFGASDGEDLDDLPEDEEWNGLPESTRTNTMTNDFGRFGKGVAA